MSKPSPRKVVVTQSRRLTPNIQRICLSGEAFNDFPAVSPGAYIKLMFDLDGCALQSLTDIGQVAMRTYTVSHFDVSKPEMFVDMVIHSNDGITGPGAAWALSAKPGDEIFLAGPGSSKSLSDHYDWVLLAGDLTALPSIRNHLASLPPHVEGYAVIKVDDKNDATPLNGPQGVEVIWETNLSLPERLTSIEWRTGLPAVWVACEFSDMRKIRTWLKEDRNVPHEQVYISSYWKRGRSEDQHKIDKRQDTEAFMKSSV